MAGKPNPKIDDLFRARLSAKVAKENLNDWERSRHPEDMAQAVNALYQAVDSILEHLEGNK